MSTGPLPEKLNHRKAAADRLRLEGSIRLDRFTRLTPLLEHSDGCLQVQLVFRPGRKRRTLVVGHGEMIAPMICQSCLEPVDIRLAVRLRLVLVDSEKALLELPASDDAIVVATDRVVLADLLEDELLLELPMIPRHSEGSCTANREQVVVPDQPLTHRPFEGLSAYRESFTDRGEQTSGESSALKGKA